MIDVLQTYLKPHRYLVVAFTGIGHALGGIPFEFHRTLAGVDCSVLFVRDLERRWYQYPDGDVSAPRAVAAAIMDAKRSCGAERLVLLGNSMGGFGALLLARWVDADHVLAFSPQTAITSEFRAMSGDDRWSVYWDQIPQMIAGDLRQMPEPPGRRTLVYGADDRLDALHAERLADAWRCDLLPIAGTDHTVSTTLRDRGFLAPLIAGVIDGSDVDCSSVARLVEIQHAHAGAHA